MELIFSDPTYDNPSEDGMRILAELKDAIKGLDKNAEFRETDIGHGASWPVILAILGGIFLLGDKIDKNLNAWLSIAKKLVTFIKWSNEKLGLVRIDEKAAILVAINDLAKSDQFSTIEILENKIIPFNQFPNNTEVLSKTPDALYLIFLSVDQRIIIYGIKSKGNIEFKHSFSTEWYEF